MTRMRIRQIEALAAPPGAVKAAALTVKQTPMIFMAAMVRAIFAEVKTQTRRTRGLEKINRQPDEWEFIDLNGVGNFVFRWRRDTTRHIQIECPYGDIDDLLWVRETWLRVDSDHLRDGQRFAYRTDQQDDEGERCRIEYGYKWRPSIYMPREACRLTL